MDASGNIALTRGLWGGALDRSPIGIHPREHENPADTFGRQRFFYDAVAELATSDWLFAQYWFQGGPMDTVISEYTFALDEAVRRGQLTAEESLRLNNAYKHRATAFFSMEGLSSLSRNCDGAFVGMVDRMPAEIVMDQYGWDAKKSELISSDLAVAWPLKWIRQLADKGELAYHFYLEKSGQKPGALGEFKARVAQMMRESAEWKAYRDRNRIADNVEESLAGIALDYWRLEDQPEWHRKLYAEKKAAEEQHRAAVYFTNGMIGGVDINAKCDPGKPDMGILPADDVYWSNLDQPTGIIKAKHSFLRDPETLRDLHDALTYADAKFPPDPDNPDKNNGMPGRIPSEISVKDMKRFTKVWDSWVGGSQATMLADFSKFPEGLDALCNLYNGIPHMSDVVGWMVGKILLVKAKALLTNAGDKDFLTQMFKMLQLGDEDTPKELETAYGGVLGSGGEGTFGAIAKAVGQYDLHIGTKDYYDAIALLRTGIYRTGWAYAGQWVLAATSVFNRAFSMGGKRRGR